jgi:hypothetical protein
VLREGEPRLEAMEKMVGEWRDEVGSGLELHREKWPKAFTTLQIVELKS